MCNKSCSSSKTNTCRNNLFACRFDFLALGVIHACEWDDWRSPKLLLCLDCFLRWGSCKGFQAFQSSRICFKYSEKQIGLSHRNLYNLHLFSNSSPAKTWLPTRNRIFSFHIRRYHLTSKEPRFRLLEIEANAVIYIQIFSNQPGTQAGHVRDRN